MEIVALGITLVAVAGLERIPSARFQPLRFFRPFLLTDAICLLTGGIVLSAVLRGGAMELAAAIGPNRVPFGAVSTAVFALVLYDLGAYLAHALLHHSDVLWEIHKVHHSSRTLDWLATFRAHLLEHALRHTLSPVTLLLGGFPVSSVGFAAVAHTAWAVLNHANVGLPLRFLEGVLITPRLHRLHHVPSTGARNLGTLFSLWDRLRGSLVSDARGVAVLGVPGEIDSYPQRWLALFLEPLRRLCARQRAQPITSPTSASAP